MATNERPSEQEQPQFIEIPDPTHRLFRSTILERAVAVYLVQETELDQLSSGNTITTVFASATMSLVTIAVTFWIAGQTAGPDVSERAEALFDVVPIIAAMAAAVFLWVTIGMWRRGSSVLKQIKTESKHYPAQLVTSSPDQASITRRSAHTPVPDAERPAPAPGER